MRLAIVLSSILLTSIMGLQVSAQSSAFSYQGRLTDTGSSASGSYDMQFTLHSAVSGLGNGMGRARDLAARRVLFVGTDMSCGKMTAALELDRSARAREWNSRFLATGQIGIVIAGDGLALDAVRIDFATGAVEQLVMQAAPHHDLLFIEGQGSLLHPASTATLAAERSGFAAYTWA